MPISWGPRVSEHGPLGYRYAYVNGSFYEPEVRDVGDRTGLALNRTPADEALRGAATPLSNAGGDVREAVRSGGVETRHELDGADEFWERDGTYYVVYEAVSRTYGRHAYLERVRFGSVVETVLTVVGMAVGPVLVLRGQRRRVAAEWREVAFDDE